MEDIVNWPNKRVTWEIILNRYIKYSSYYDKYFLALSGTPMGKTSSYISGM